MLVCFSQLFAKKKLGLFSASRFYGLGETEESSYDFDVLRERITCKASITIFLQNTVVHITKVSEAY